MHNILTRINNVSALLSSCLMGLVAVIALSSVLLEMVEATRQGSSTENPAPWERDSVLGQTGSRISLLQQLMIWSLQLRRHAWIVDYV